MKMKVFIFFLSVGLCLLYRGVSGVDPEKVSVMEGDSVTLHTGVQKKQQDRIMWYYNDTRIAQINGDPRKTCTDVQCEGGDERFRGRLKLDHQTGSLTIKDIRTTDIGDYQLKISITKGSSDSSSDSEKIFSVSVRESVSVKEGDSVTLHTGVQKKQQDRIMWYYNDTRIALINGDPRKTCTDVQCEGGDERFRGRLKLDHQTGSLTIKDIRTTDIGDYQLTINSDREKIFSVSVRGVSKRYIKSVKEGQSVTLYPDVINPNDVMTWRFNDTLIAKITGDQSQICSDDQCKERFRDRLKLDHQNGSLTITDIRSADSGEYTLEITNSRFSRHRRSISRGVNRFKVSVTGSGLSSAAIAGIVAVVLAVFAAAAAGVIYYRRRSFRKDDCERNSDDPVRRPIRETEAAEQD